MLVAVAVVVVMMTLFATIFQMATKTMSVQKGLSENDQRVRLVIAMLRNDLNGQAADLNTGAKKQTRTFRTLIPFAAGETGGNPPVNPVNQSPVVDLNERLGYFTISEGNINDDTDDLLQFTVNLDASSADRLFGRTAVILPDGNGQFGPAGTTPPPAPYTPGTAPYLPTNPAVAPLVPTPTNGHYWFNQPEFDDVLGTPNQAGSSTAAEVAYFLRNGTLYRRVMLIRLPNIVPTPPTGQPIDENGANLSFAAYSNAQAQTGQVRNFWTDFDYSGYYLPTGPAPGVQFFGINDLDPNFNGSLTALCSPANRWGFDYTSNAGAGYGLPRERDSNGNFLGRFTHAETSDPTFGYPGRYLAGTTNNPMASTTNVQLTSGTASPYTNGTRRGEDVLMTNVIAFDIKVWDPAASMGPDGLPGIANVNDDGINGTDDFGEIGAYGSDDGDWRDIGHPGFTPSTAAGALPIPQPPYGFYRAYPTLTNPNQYYSDPTGALAMNNGRPTNRYDTWGPSVSISNTIGTTDSPPYRPIWAGPDGKPGVANQDDDKNGTIDDASELGWMGGAAQTFPVTGQSSDDFAPLTAIKITIRFYDVTSNQVRDISEVFTLAFKQ